MEATIDWTETAGVEAAEAAPEVLYDAEALRRRIDLYCRHLHGGVHGTLAIAYLRQIADDEDQLSRFDELGSLALQSVAPARLTCGAALSLFLDLCFNKQEMNLLMRRTRATSAMGEAMSHKTATVEEFITEGDKVIHTPTGAWFSAYKGQPHIAHRSWGHAGEASPNGDQYGQDEIQEIAEKLLRARIRLSPA